MVAFIVAVSVVRPFRGCEGGKKLGVITSQLHPGLPPPPVFAGEQDVGPSEQGADVCCGAFGGIYFAHRNPETGDIVGFEQRWEKDGRKNTARFAKGGLKTVSVLGNQKTATRMVVFEGGLDALALAELESWEDTIYVSTGGGFGPRTETALVKLAEGRQVLSGFDNDAAGDVLHRQLAGLLPQVTRLAPASRVEGSTQPSKDWLDVLNASKGASSPAMQPARPRSVGEVENEVQQPVRSPHLDEPEMPGPG